MPGLLQTKAYATGVFQVARPEMTPEEIDRGVALRLGRQALLTRTMPPAPQVDILLDEAALRRGADAEQLGHIVNLRSSTPTASPALSTSTSPPR
ncbi:Scr1 family TA system antitoxin-like transcriptional regulator [Micromonospora sp. NPDC020750]|uniref:Scr1 family TA system antitoxin-like transcriptional regulator n=1 Tax=unclassified Micromonospora TaxID=2617518 RepID=UPI00379822FE